MKTLSTIARRMTLFIVSAILVVSTPMAVFAEEVAPPPVEEDPGYVYDAATGRWSSNKYTYDPTTGTYIVNTGSASNNTVEGPIEGSISDTGPASTNEIQDNSQATTEANVDNTLQVDHEVAGTAISGDASVNSNTVAGSATSGDAATIATIMNNLNSSSALSGQPYTFTKDVYGDVYGDIELAPDLLKAFSQQTATQPVNGTINYNVLNNNTLNNDVDLDALSGDASVLNNTIAGNATSGNATAVANVLNVINSVIAANQSFVGTINIHGNLNGDILLNREGSPALITSNAASNPLASGTLIANNTNLTEIINNIELNATSGNASVNRNTNAGDATSGEAKTNLVVMDLVGHQVNAKNAILVFVNVLGKWVGIIVDAPTGATAAVLGDDVTNYLIAQTGPDSNNQINGDPTTTDTTINNTTHNKITNNISVDAHSGDATVSGNTNAGNATTGDASASATVMNMVNSAFSLSGWFGVLFINVFGSWDGSALVDTESGGKGGAPAPAVSTPVASVPSVTDIASAAPVAQIFRFIERTSASSNSNSSTEDTVLANQPNVGAVLAASSQPKFSPAGVVKAVTDAPQISIPVAIGILALLAALIFIIIRVIAGIRDRIAYSH